ncbi:MAG: hypothetical protein Q8876_05975 [Bacillota bacterium]|nr:hypothetical protein [Bacillota bacterium]
MKKQIILLIICWTEIILFLSSCSNANEIKSTSNQNSTSIATPSSVVSKITINDLKHSTIIAQSKNYKLLKGDNQTYYYYLYDNKGTIVNEGGFLGRYPKFSSANNIVSVSLQTGTGIETKWIYFYNTLTNKLSQTFYGVFDECNNLVAYYGQDGKSIIVQDIFDKSQYYREISSFKDTLAKDTSPIINAKFSKDLKSICITYLSQNDHNKISENFNVN